jgi:hypothetical protein
MSLFHSVIAFASMLSYNQLAQSYTVAVSHEAANLAFESKRLFLCGFGKLAL